MKKSEIRLIFIIIIALAITSLATAFISYIIFLTEWPDALKFLSPDVYNHTIPNIVTCTMFAMLSIATLITMPFFKYIKNEKIRKIVTIASMAAVLIFNLIACCVAKYTDIQRLSGENLINILTLSISTLILILAIGGIMYLNHKENISNSENIETK
ncbi:MAG: hypothetical protein IJY90_00505 [Clostridia bacterium]|nr:hypothetical protein [Clostridia bacterium]